ncbi:MAG: hypothetical protein H7838_13030 [Magnetococcus sp. DMHC-8]
MENKDPIGEQGMILKQLAALLELDDSASQGQRQPDGADLPVVLFRGFAVTSLILSTLLAFELWAGY